MRPQSFSDTKVVYLLAELKIDIPSFLAEPLEHRQRDHCQRIFLDSISIYEFCKWDDVSIDACMGGCTQRRSVQGWNYSCAIISIYSCAVISICRRNYCFIRTQPNIYENI